jgi:hypothetical protein
LRFGFAALTVLLLVLLFPSCGDDNPTDSTPQPDPNISMTLESGQGLISLTVRNSGGSMSESSEFIAAYEDGESDTLLVKLDAQDSLTCQLSNIHGGVTVTNQDWDLDTTVSDCLAEYFAYTAAAIDLSDYVSSPAAQATVLLCTYTVYVNNLQSNSQTFQLVRTDDGLTLRFEFSGISADLVGTSPGPLCADFTGSVTISSIVVESDIAVDEAGNPQVTLAGTKATISGFNVNVDGAFGFVVELILSFFEDTFTNALEGGIEDAVNSLAGSGLDNLVIVTADCAE